VRSKKREFIPIDASDIAESEFMKFVLIEDAGCWIWIGGTACGYGIFRGYRAHRFAYALFLGIDPGPMNVCHHCDTPPCVNPSHMFLGDHKSNAADRESKNRGNHIFGGDTPWSKISNAQAAEIKRLAEEGKFRQREIAEMFGVTQSHVSHIKRGSYWRCLDVGR
jgi:hypothetical protein